jgi:hypothetical protein
MHYDYVALGASQLGHFQGYAGERNASFHEPRNLVGAALSHSVGT